MSSNTVLDDRTTDAIREAIVAAGKGQMAEACAIGERALAAGGDTAALNAMLGMLKCRSGNIEAAIDHLLIAHATRSGDTRIATNLVNALAEAGRHREGFDILTETLARTDPTMQLERLRGFLAQNIDEFPFAVSSYERVVAAYPLDWESWNNLGNARRSAADFEGSIQALRKAAALAPGSPPVLLNLALAIGAAGDLLESERLLRQLGEDFPTEARPLRELHALLKEQGRDDEALEAIESALSRDPSNIETLLALGSHQSLLQQYDSAESAYRGVLAREPSNGVGHLGLALVYELTNRTTDLSNLALEAEHGGVDPDSLNFIRTLVFRREKRFEEGLRTLELVPDTIETSRRAHLLGQLLEGAGRYDEAFEAFARMNEIGLEDPSLPEQRGANYRATIRSQFETLALDWVAGWRQEAKLAEMRSPAFLVGFPRSGTTLLDTMLMGHPRIEVLEEEPTLREANKHFPDFASLPTASDSQVEATRNAYFEAVKALTPLRPGNLLVDKNPLAMNSMPLIHRLFPEAKVILALRHPCDVVLSCFITNFRANDGMASFQRLETAAELYDLSFRYFHRALDLFKQPVHRVVYENVVADRETELKALFDFLELEWSDQVLEHEATAMGRGRIKTASYSQVTEPIYTRASGRWWNYRKHLEPVFPVLQPWVEKFGYSLDDPTLIPADKAGK